MQLKSRGTNKVPLFYGVLIVKKETQQFILDNVIWLLWSVFYALSFPTYNLSFAVWFIFIPVFVFAYTRPIYLTIRYAFVYSFPFLLLAFYWLYGFWMPSLFLIFPLYALFFAFFFGCIAYVGKKLKKGRWLVVPMLWLSCELLRTVGYHGFFWNMLGDSQWHNTVLIQSADIFGVWGISFFILMVNSVFADIIYKYLEKGSLKKLISRNNASKLSVVSALFVFIIVYGVVQLNHYQSVSDHSPKEKLAMLQPNIGSHEPWFPRMWENYGIFWKLNAEAAVNNPDMIIWPETMVKNFVWSYLETYPLDSEVNLFNIRFVKMPREFNIPILFTSPNQIGEYNYNTADYLDPATPYYLLITNQFFSRDYIIPNTDVVQNNSKIHLVPFGEWMPLYDTLGFVKKIMNIEGAGSFRPSTNFNVIQSRKSRFRVLVCFEDLFAQLARKFIKNRLNYFITVSNTGWAYRLGFRHPMWQHLAGSALTAVSVRRPIARATNTGVTGIIDITGIFKGDVGDYQRGIYVGEVSLVDVKIESIYVQFGYLFPYAVFFICMLIFIQTVFQDLFNTKNNKQKG
jgi:apolipoprotein N-acyltransferase